MRSRIAARAISLASGVIALTGCVDSTGPAWVRIEEADFASTLQVDLAQMTKLNGGVYIQDLSVGTGRSVQDVDLEVDVDFEVFLSDGRLMDSSVNFRFITGCLQIPRGFEAGVWFMNVGGTRRIIVPPALGYGSNPPVLSPIPPGAILVYVVTVTGVRGRSCVPESSQ